MFLAEIPWPLYMDMQDNTSIIFVQKLQLEETLHLA